MGSTGTEFGNPFSFATVAGENSRQRLGERSALANERRNHPSILDGFARELTSPVGAVPLVNEIVEQALEELHRLCRDRVAGALWLSGQAVTHRAHDWPARCRNAYVLRFPKGLGGLAYPGGQFYAVAPF
jgi:hypothetical protein